MAVRYTQALLDRATAYLATPERQRRLTQASRDELLAIYNAITGQNRDWCPACEYSDFFHIVEAYTREATRFLHPHTVSKSTYSIAPQYANEQFVHENYGQPITADNLTDEAAEFFVKNGYGYAFLKNGQPIEAAAAGTDTTDGSTSTDKADAEPSASEKKAAEAQKKAETSAEKHKQEVADTKKALKAEKDAHADTKKELADARKVLADTEKQLADLHAKYTQPGDEAAK